jgi:hypothetical protein
MSTSHSILTSTSAQNQDRLLRTIVACRSGAGQAVAAEEYHRAAILHAALMHEAGIAPAGIGSLLAAMRRLTGTALIRSGEWLRGRPVVSPVTQV